MQEYSRIAECIKQQDACQSNFDISEVAVFFEGENELNPLFIKAEAARKNRLPFLKQNFGYCSLIKN